MYPGVKQLLLLVGLMLVACRPSRTHTAGRADAAGVKLAQDPQRAYISAGNRLVDLDFLELEGSSLHLNDDRCEATSAR